MKEMKGRKRREREWKSQLGEWRRSRRAPSGKFGSGIREFYHGVQWPTRVSAHVGSNCLPLLAERKRTGVYVISSPPTSDNKKAIGTSVCFKYSEWGALWMSNKITSSQRFPSRYAFWYSQIFTWEGSQHLTAWFGVFQQWCHSSVLTWLMDIQVACSFLMPDIKLHFCYR